MRELLVVLYNHTCLQNKFIANIHVFCFKQAALFSLAYFIGMIGSIATLSQWDLSKNGINFGPPGNSSKYFGISGVQVIRSYNSLTRVCKSVRLSTAASRAI